MIYKQLLTNTYQNKIIILFLIKLEPLSLLGERGLFLIFFSAIQL